jgi:hypothetical protein
MNKLMQFILRENWWAARADKRKSKHREYVSQKFRESREYKNREWTTEQFCEMWDVLKSKKLI